MNTILFDLDGTLLPLNQEDFVDTYFKLLKSRMEQAGYDAKAVLQGVYAGTQAMIENEGIMTNEEMFFHIFQRFVPKDKLQALKREFMQFYQKDFEVLKLHTKPTPYAAKAVKELKRKGYMLVVATNPLFPIEAIEKRMEWAELDKNDFTYITSYENTCYCKPNLNYYKRILWGLDKLPEDCLMVGNDATEDLCAAKLGIDVFMLKECLINTKNIDLSDYKKGTWETFSEYISDFPTLE